MNDTFYCDANVIYKFPFLLLEILKQITVLFSVVGLQFIKYCLFKDNFDFDC